MYIDAFGRTALKIGLCRVDFHGTFDGAWDDSLTVEGCMKHSYNRQSLELEPLKIGKHLFKSLYDWSFMI